MSVFVFSRWAAFSPPGTLGEGEPRWRSSREGRGRNQDWEHNGEHWSGKAVEHLDVVEAFRKSTIAPGAQDNMKINKPTQFGPENTLTVTADQDDTHRETPAAWRIPS